MWCENLWGEKLSPSNYTNLEEERKIMRKTDEEEQEVENDKRKDYCGDETGRRRC